MKDSFLKNQVAVITGAGGTLCSEVAGFLGAKGATVVLIGRTGEKLQAAAKPILDRNGTCVVKQCDVSDEKQVQAVAREIADAYGLCRYLVNGAGGNNIKAMTTNTRFDPQELSAAKPAEMNGFFNLNMEIFEEVLKANTLGTVIPCRIFGRQMAENGGGVILNFASMNSYSPLTRVSAYAMSKAAIVNFTQWLAGYLAPAGIRVNAIAPGFFINERSRNYLCRPDGGLSARGEKVMQHTPMGRFGEAKDLLGCVEWLLDDEKAAFVTGITVPIDGGFLCLSGV